MQALLRRVFGIPATAEKRTQAIDTLLRSREPAAAYEFMFAVMSHNTGKAGALLAAQGMFAVVGTYGMEHGWTKSLVLPSMLLLMLGALLAMSILRSTMGAFSPSGRDPFEALFDITMHRVVRLNLAMYVTFVSIVMLIAATILQA
jgi:hypothetical protein